MWPLELRFYEVNLPRSLFSLVCDAQCCEVRIHFAIISGEQPLPIKNNKSLKVSLSPAGLFQKICCMSVGQAWIE